MNTSGAMIWVGLGVVAVVLFLWIASRRKKQKNWYLEEDTDDYMSPPHLFGEQSPVPPGAQSISPPIDYSDPRMTGTAVSVAPDQKSGVVSAGTPFAEQPRRAFKTGDLIKLYDREGLSDSALKLLVGTSLRAKVTVGARGKKQVQLCDRETGEPVSARKYPLRRFAKA